MAESPPEPGVQLSPEGQTFQAKEGSGGEVYSDCIAKPTGRAWNPVSVKDLGSMSTTCLNV